MKTRERLRAMARLRMAKVRGVARFAAITVLLWAAWILPATAQVKTKKAAANRDGLADYVERVSAKTPDPAPTTPGSLWIDSGRLANMVADYKAARVGDLVT